MDFLPPTTSDSFFISPTDCNEVSSINNHKTVKPNSIPTKILKLLNKDISNQLASLFNILLSSGIFPYIFKTSETIPIPKKRL